MYSSKYSQVSKYSPEAQKRMQYRSKGKSCGYYMRIVFFFSSLIQSLIIISLVLFLIYGQKQDSASTSRIHDLEESFSRFSIENRELKQQRKNLTTFLNYTLIEKARLEWDLAKQLTYINTSLVLFQEMEKRLQLCAGELVMCKTQGLLVRCPTPISDNSNCGLQMEQMKARLILVGSNFTQTVQRMRMDMDQITKDRDNLNLEAIRLRRDKSTHEKEVDFLKKKCKEDFSESLSGVSRVTSSLLVKIDSLFPTHLPFQLTCPKQRDHLEQIRTNCTSLSTEVEDRLQRYLNNVGDQVSNIQSESSRLKAENWRLSEDYRWCSQNRTGLIQQYKQSQVKLQLEHDQAKEKLLIDKMKLQGEIEVLDNNVKYKTKEVEHLVEQIKHLNMTCRGGFGGGFGMGQQPRTGSGGFGSSLPGGGSGSQSFGLNKPGSGLSLNSGSYGSTYNKPNNAAGSSSSFMSPSGSSNSGYGSNKPASSGFGSSSSSSSSSGSSNSGYGSNKPASSGFGSSGSSSSSSGSSNSGYGSNKPASSGTGSSFFSSGSSSSSGSGSSKPASSGTGSSFFSSGSSSSSGSGSSKPASSGTGSSFFSSGSSSSSGSGSSKPASSGTGSSFFSSGSSSSSGSGSSKPASSGTGSSFFSSGSSSSSGSGSSKPASSGFGSSGSSSSSSSSSRGSSSFGSSASSSAKSPSSSGSSASGSPASASKSSSSGTSSGWFNSWGSSSSSGQSKTGTGSSKPSSTGSATSYGTGRSSGLGGGSVNFAQHIRDLQRLINPNLQEEKQDLSRMLG